MHEGRPTGGNLQEHEIGQRAGRRIWDVPDVLTVQTGVAGETANRCGPLPPHDPDLFRLWDGGRRGLL